MKKQIFYKPLFWFLLFFTVTLNVNADSADPIHYLLVQYAPKAEIEHNENDNSYAIILKEVPPYVTYFSERPGRKSGAMPIQEFIDLWHHKHPNNFTVNPPNADLTAIETQAAKPVNFAVELSNPQYNAETKILRYVAKPLENISKLLDKTTVHYVSIFIDDVCLSCW